MNQLNKLAKTEFSKKIIMGVGGVTFAVTLFTCYMVYVTKDLTPLNYLIGCVFGAFSAAAGFYYNKAKKENELKLRKKYGAEVYNDVKKDLEETNDWEVIEDERCNSETVG